eukprot:scaffold113655_cov75-Phaeocystis_antarctica.AAC.2
MPRGPRPSCARGSAATERPRASLASCAIDRLLRHAGRLCKTQEEHPAQQMYTLVSWLADRHLTYQPDNHEGVSSEATVGAAVLAGDHGQDDLVLRGRQAGGDELGEVEPLPREPHAVRLAAGVQAFSDAAVDGNLKQPKG